LLALGCATNTTETGYEYRPLSDTANIRAAYYAQPFTPAAAAAAGDRRDQFNRRRPDVHR
jgi:hypothetical protein